MHGEAAPPASLNTTIHRTSLRIPAFGLPPPFIGMRRCSDENSDCAGGEQQYRGGMSSALHKRREEHYCGKQERNCDQLGEHLFLQSSEPGPNIGAKVVPRHSAKGIVACNAEHGNAAPHLRDGFISRGECSCVAPGSPMMAS